MTTVTPAEINRFWIEEVGPKVQNLKPRQS